MSQRKQGSDNLLIHHGFLVLRILIGLVILLSCENDIEKINELTSELHLPQQTGYDVEIAFTDSGVLKWKLFAPEINRYESKDNPYIEFPRGIKIIDYDRAGKVESRLTANYAIYYQEDQLGEAKNNVVAIKETTGEKLYTEQLFWDQKSEIVYSNTFSRIINDQGTHIGEKGFEAKQDLSRWKLHRSRGTVKIKNEPED
ncbi:MAG: LPS export ABC transporter periplasmic protein LptC [Bacteroidales bacterium]|nr:LPS export ABC transporter periplasmic protein LptC [Bacteroidales bacterium]